MSEIKPAISVVIPAYRCADSIADVIDALLAQAIPPSKIIGNPQPRQPPAPSWPCLV
jgi:hypothetical protein